MTANPHTFVCPAKEVHAEIESECRRIWRDTQFKYIQT